MNLEDLDKTSSTRHTSLSTVCILTFIGSGLALLSYLYFTVFYKELADAIRYEEVYDSIPGLKDAMEMMLAPGLPFFLLLALTNFASLCGAYLMWKLKKIGFHVYTLAQIVSLLLPFLFGAAQGIPFGSLFWSGLFVAFYAMHLKYMKPLDLKSNETNSNDSNSEDQNPM
ncbi:MAG: hypothetical protein RSC04_03705 [Bacteroidales bacterium]